MESLSSPLPKPRVKPLVDAQCSLSHLSAIFGVVRKTPTIQTHPPSSQRVAELLNAMLLITIEDSNKSKVLSLLGTFFGNSAYSLLIVSAMA